MSIDRNVHSFSNVTNLIANDSGGNTQTCFNFRGFSYFDAEDLNSITLLQLKLSMPINFVKAQRHSYLILK